MQSSGLEIRGYRFGSFEIDLHTGELSKDGSRVKLQNKSFEVLRLLLERAGELVTREELEGRLWPGGTFVDFGLGINVAVKKLRDALEDSPEGPRFIETLSRRGYRFIAPVEAVRNGSPVPTGAAEDAAVPATPVRLPEPARQSSGRVPYWLAVPLVAAVIALAAVLAVRFWPAGPPVLAFQERDWVLITSFDNRSGEPVFDGTLEYALERELSNSQFVNVVPRERIEDALRLMKRPADTRVEASLGREICLRDGGIRALLRGRVEKLDSTYVLSVLVVEPAGGATVASFSEEAAGAREVVPALRRLASRVRETLGEELPRIRQSEQHLEKATTPSLHALRLYTQGRALVDWPASRGEWEPAAQYFQQAVAEDPEFASAHLWLGWSYHNLGREKEAAPRFQRAFELADTTVGHERSFILGSYYWGYAKDLERAAQAFEFAARLYPDHSWTIHKLMEIYREQGRHRQAAPYVVHLADLRPQDFSANALAARELIYWERNPARARPYLHRAQVLISAEAYDRDPWLAGWIELMPAYEHWARGEVGKTAGAAARMQQKLNSHGVPRDALAIRLWGLYGTLGKLKAAEESVQMVADPGLRQEYLMWSALQRGDRPRLLKLFRSLRVPDGEAAKILARAGLLAEAQIALSYLEKQADIPAWALLPVRAELALARGQPEKAIALLQAEARRAGGDRMPIPPVTLPLARAYEQQGDLPKAIRTLEAGAKEKMWAASAGWSYPADWLHVQSERARLYRKAGRAPEAETIEAELLKLLAYADSDHPLLRQLRSQATSK